MKKITDQMKKPDTDLINRLNTYPRNNSIHHPIVIKSTAVGAILAAIIVAVFTWLIASGAAGKEEPITATVMNPDILPFIGFILGAAIGGLIGNVLGIFLMLKERG